MRAGDDTLGLPLSVPELRRDLFSRLLDGQTMLGILQRELPTLTDVPIQVTGCRIRVGRSRSAMSHQLIRISYRVQVVAGAGGPREVVLLGCAPVGPEALERTAGERERLAGHPAVQPFERLGTYVPELQLALHLFPVDPELPAIAEFLGPEGPGMLALALRLPAGVAVGRMQTELRHYKAFNRAVLRVSAELSGPGVGNRAPVVYVKFFCDERGAASFDGLNLLWAAARSARCLRVPEPLAYDAGRRMLIMREAPGRTDLTEWIRCLERGEPLPPGVDLARVRGCMLVVAEALAELQTCALPLSERRTCASELRQIGKDKQLLESQGELLAQQPALVRRVLALLERLGSLALDEGAERLFPAHGGFRHKQMVGDEHGLTVIDWDGLCLANPAFDAAKFLARLHEAQLLDPGRRPVMEQLADGFRRAFLERVPAASARDLDFYEATVFTERAFRAFRRAEDRVDAVEHIGRLAATAEQLLDRVERGT